MKTSLNIFLLFLILCASCGSRKANDNKETAVQADTVRKFTLPLIPAMLNTPELRADYLVRHYWDNMDFTDTTYINLPDVTEQAWVDFIDILKIVPDTTAIAAIRDKITQTMAMFVDFLSSLASEIAMNLTRI